jgi:hypothetical protein
MSKTHAERIAERALTLTCGDWAEATRQLCHLAASDPELLLELTGPYLRGAAAKAVHLAARRLEAEHPAGAGGRVSVPVSGGGAGRSAAAWGAAAPTLLSASIGGRQQPFQSVVWDAIISHMQGNADMDSEQHEKALRVIAKAFAAKRLEERAERGTGRR